MLANRVVITDRKSIGTAMAASSSVLVAQFSYTTTSSFINPKCLAFSRQFNRQESNFIFTTATHTHNSALQGRTRLSCLITCSASDKPTPSPQFSSDAKIRSEVLTPFRSVRMFFYLAFIASASLGGLIATTQLIGALSNPSRAAEVPKILEGLGIDIAAVSVFAYLYSGDNNAKNAQLARLTREENLSNLKLRVDEKKVVPVNAFRGFARLVIVSGPSSFISESFKLSEPFTEGLLERGVLVVPFATDGELLDFQFDESEERKELTGKRKRLWQLIPVFSTEWSKWLDEQKKLANVSSESSVYLSLRLDGRVRGSGVGYPPWNAFVAQLPPVKGLWSGLFDGFDGRV